MRLTQRRSIIQWVLYLVLLSGTACRSTNIGAATEDFEGFYQRFLTDSLFQMERIQFPLPGERVTDVGQDTTYHWTRDEWIMLKEFDLDTTQYRRDLQVTDTLTTDEIYTPGAGFYFKMVYEPVNQKWHLVYLIDQQL
ncbi:MAG: hypothetical protein RIG62_29185 [Cyclobacteriaceae bacterium]